MKLSRFILTHMDQILGEWEAFARSLSPLTTAMPEADLQDHARQMLNDIAADMETSENEQQKKDKS
ncbi:MAG: sensor histidine kinase, partial [Bdellovibrionales bacterium]|nr:sensor histidine kinase [Massilia sp.]